MSRAEHLHSLESGSFDNQALIDSDVVFCLDAELRITYCDATWDKVARPNGAADFGQPALGHSILDCMAEPDRTCYGSIFRRVLTQGQPWEHLYQYSAVDFHRQFRVHVLPLMRETGLMVIISLGVDQFRHGVGCVTGEKAYRNGQGLILMCCGCRRTRRGELGMGAEFYREAALVRQPRYLSGMPYALLRGRDLRGGEMPQHRAFDAITHRDFMLDA